MSKRRVHKQTTKEVFDRYDYYFRSVQSPETDVLFFRKVYRDLRGQNPKILREDFCGTFANCCEWVKLSKENRAIGLDLDPEPLAYGRDKWFPAMSADQIKRIQILEEDVRSLTAPQSDVTVALNFSYFIFHKRMELKKYFELVKKRLKPKGIFVLDMFGGSACQDANEEVTNHRSFKYFWDQESFDPVTHRAKFHIHFQVAGHKKVKNAFSYDWRMWTIPELQELLTEVGFSTTQVYWEGTNKKGRGNGVFRRVSRGESCEAWIAYLVAGA